LIEHWDGTAWSVVPSPDLGSPGGVPFDHLSAVSATSRNDAWAFGSFGNQPGIGYDDRALIEHWDGSSWTVAKTFPRSSGLQGAVALSPTDSWAVGGIGRLHSVGPLIEHWNGQAWARVLGPAGQAMNLIGVAADAAGDLWAVGSRGYADQRTLALQCLMSAS
jgi:hypothetical protein